MPDGAISASRCWLRSLVGLLGLQTGVALAEVESHIILQTSPLAGFQHHAGRALFPLFSLGDRLIFVREPGNPYDPNAVRVEWRGAVIGYAPRRENPDLARLMDLGARAEGRVIHLQIARDPWKRMLMEVLIAMPDVVQETSSLPHRESVVPEDLRGSARASPVNR